MLSSPIWALLQKLLKCRFGFCKPASCPHTLASNIHFDLSYPSIKSHTEDTLRTKTLRSKFNFSRQYFHTASQHSLSCTVLGAYCFHPF